MVIGSRARLRGCLQTKPHRSLVVDQLEWSLIARQKWPCRDWEARTDTHFSTAGL